MERDTLKHRAYKLKSRYNITLQDFDNLLEKQAASCGVCFTPFEPSAVKNVDHCHTTGKVRGIVCTNCNLALGHLKDFPEVAESAANYLRRHE